MIGKFQRVGLELKYWTGPDEDPQRCCRDVPQKGFRYNLELLYESPFDLNLEVETTAQRKKLKFNQARKGSPVETRSFSISGRVFSGFGLEGERKYEHTPVFHGCRDADESLQIVVTRISGDYTGFKQSAPNYDIRLVRH